MVDREFLSCPAALPGLNELAMLIISSSVAELKKIDRGKFLERQSVCEYTTVEVIRFATLGPILVKYFPWDHKFPGHLF